MTRIGGSPDLREAEGRKAPGNDGARRFERDPLSPTLTADGVANHGDLLVYINVEVDRPDESAIRLAWAEALQKLGKAQDAREQRQLAAKLP